MAAHKTAEGHGTIRPLQSLEAILDSAFTEAFVQELARINKYPNFHKELIKNVKILPVKIFRPGHYCTQGIDIERVA